ncbi:MAG TPA: gamma-glutamyl-gamma-aminobutyrate hydrolase family protein, partial [Chloroflexi bacterium]|nr:gamma-glutamyl-gamma-aminobutyrate hydrolase family protein [Chloroflexota bacterium]
MTAPLIGITTAHRQRRHPPPVTLAAIPATYVQAVVQAGGVPILIPLGVGEDALAVLISRLDGLLLPGGEDVEPGLYGEPPHPRLGKVDPERDRLEIAVTRLALDAQIPILALCRGHQVLNVALGGSLYQDIPSQCPEAIVHQAPNHQRLGASHLITVDAGSRLAQIIGPGPMVVNSFHHQAIKALAPGLG